MASESECRMRAERAEGLAMVLRWTGKNRDATVAEMVAKMWAACAVAKKFNRGSPDRPASNTRRSNER